MTELETTFSMWRKSVHDYKNTVLAINSMVKEKKYNELSEYLDNEIKGFENHAEYIHTGNATADTVINAKYIAAQKQNISFTVNAVMPKERVYLSFYTLCLHCNKKEKEAYMKIKKIFTAIIV